MLSHNLTFFFKQIWAGALLSLLCVNLPQPLAADYDPSLSAPRAQSILVIYAPGSFGDNAVTIAQNLPNTFAGTNGSGFNFSVTYLAVNATANGFTDDLATAGLSLSAFDQVWDLRFWNTAAPAGTTAKDTMTAADMTALGAYLAGGGSLYLQGENEDFHSRDDGLVTFLNTYVNNGATIPYPGVCSTCGSFAIDLTNSAIAENFANDFHTLSPIT
jgi:hypothetical protein